MVRHFSEADMVKPLNAFWEAALAYERALRNGGLPGDAAEAVYQAKRKEFLDFLDSFATAKYDEFTGPAPACIGPWGNWAIRVDRKLAVLKQQVCQVGQPAAV